MNTNKNQAGFSLIELLIVVAIIGIIAAIAVPNLFASRRASNEAAAVANLRAITSAEATYRATSGNGNYGTLAQLHASGALVDSVLAAAGTTPKGGYLYAVTVFTATSTEPVGYLSGARPVNAGSGARRFLSDEAGVIYYDTDVDAALPTTGRASGSVLGS